MVYYEETKLISNWQLNTVLALSSAEAPSVEKRQENGETEKSGKRGWGGGGWGRPFKGEEQLKLFLSPFPSLPERRKRALGRREHF